MSGVINEIREVLLRAGSNTGVVVEVYGAAEALVATPSGTRRLATAIGVAKGDVVTVQGGRIVAKRSTRADRTYYV